MGIKIYFQSVRTILFYFDSDCKNDEKHEVNQ